MDEHETPEQGGSGKDGPRYPTKGGGGNGGLPPGFARASEHEPEHEHYTYRAGEVLIFRADVPLLEGAGRLGPNLRRASERTPRDETLESLGLERWLTDDPVPQVVESLRQPVSIPRGEGEENLPPAAIPRVLPDHALYTHYHDWWPHGVFLRPAAPLGDLPRRRWLFPLPGAGVKIGVLDTGIDRARLGWFDGRVESRVPEDTDPLVDQATGGATPIAGHGTHVAGIVAQYAPGSRLVVRRVLGLAQHVVFDSDVAAGLLELAGAGVDIIVCCFGGPTHGNLPAPATDLAINEIRRLHPGLIVVASAGNSGVTTPHFPAGLDTVIAVGALKKGADRRAEFSNFGAWVDAAAPGEDVHSIYATGVPTQAFKGWALWSGTSMATPKVAAAIAKERAPGGWKQYVWFLRPRTARQAAYRLINDRDKTWDPEVGTIVKGQPVVT